MAWVKAEIDRDLYLAFQRKLIELTQLAGRKVTIQDGIRMALDRFTNTREGKRK